MGIKYSEAELEALEKNPVLAPLVRKIRAQTATLSSLTARAETAERNVRDLARDNGLRKQNREYAALLRSTGQDPVLTAQHTS